MRGTTTKDGKVRKAPQGSVVITNPQTGEILAMASYPTYDPSPSRQRHRPDHLEAPERQGQRASRCSTGRSRGPYAPGSTFKLFTSTAALQSGFLRPGNDHYNDTGSYKVAALQGREVRVPQLRRRRATARST